MDEFGGMQIKSLPYHRPMREIFNSGQNTLQRLKKAVTSLER